jgi:hypothetical protein
VVNHRQATVFLVQQLRLGLGPPYCPQKALMYESKRQDFYFA